MVSRNVFLRKPWRLYTHSINHTPYCKYFNRSNRRQVKKMCKYRDSNCDVIIKNISFQDHAADN